MRLYLFFCITCDKYGAYARKTRHLTFGYIQYESNVHCQKTFMNSKPPQIMSFIKHARWRIYQKYYWVLETTDKGPSTPEQSSRDRVEKCKQDNYVHVLVGTHHWLIILRIRDDHIRVPTLLHLFVLFLFFFLLSGLRDMTVHNASTRSLLVSSSSRIRARVRASVVSARVGIRLLSVVCWSC